VLADFRQLDAVFLQRIGVDGREIHAAQIEQRVHVLGRAARHDGQHVKVRAVIDHAGHLRGEPQRCTFDQAGRESHRPGIHFFLLPGEIERPRRRRRRRLGAFSALCRGLI
jgi:hypothetical protein